MYTGIKESGTGPSAGIFVLFSARLKKESSRFSVISRFEEIFPRFTRVIVRYADYSF